MNNIYECLEVFDPSFCNPGDVVNQTVAHFIPAYRPFARREAVKDTFSLSREVITKLQRQDPSFNPYSDPLAVGVTLGLSTAAALDMNGSRVAMGGLEFFEKWLKTVHADVPSTYKSPTRLVIEELTKNPDHQATEKLGSEVDEVAKILKSLTDKVPLFEEPPISVSEISPEAAKVLGLPEDRDMLMYDFFPRRIFEFRKTPVSNSTEPMKLTRLAHEIGHGITTPESPFPVGISMFGDTEREVSADVIVVMLSEFLFNAGPFYEDEFVIVEDLVELNTDQHPMAWISDVALSDQPLQSFFMRSMKDFGLVTAALLAADSPAAYGELYPYLPQGTVFNGSTPPNHPYQHLLDLSFVPK